MIKESLFAAKEREAKLDCLTHPPRLRGQGKFPSPPNILLPVPIIGRAAGVGALQGGIQLVPLFLVFFLQSPFGFFDVM